MKILFITSSRIGDAVLSTGLLEYMAQKWPDAKVTVACGVLAASLFEGYPNLERLIPIKKMKYHGHWTMLLARTVGTKWDLVVDLRNSAVSRLVRAEQCYRYGRHIDQAIHKVEQNAVVMKLDHVPDPTLWFTGAQMAEAAALIPDGAPVIGVGPAANWAAKTWPAERFIEVIKWMRARTGIFPAARVAVFAAPGEQDTAYQVFESIPEAARLDLIGRCDPGTAAAALSRCAFYIGNDSGLMHCAAAAGVPTLGLFGPSYPQVYGPWGPHCSFVATPETFDELINYPGYTPQTAPCLIESLTVEAVIEKIESFREKLTGRVAV